MSPIRRSGAPRRRRVVPGRAQVVLGQPDAPPSGRGCAARARSAAWKPRRSGSSRRSTSASSALEVGAGDRRSRRRQSSCAPAAEVPRAARRHRASRGSAGEPASRVGAVGHQRHRAGLERRSRPARRTPRRCRSATRRQLARCAAPASGRVTRGRRTARRSRRCACRVDRVSGPASRGSRRSSSWPGRRRPEVAEQDRPRFAIAEAGAACRRCASANGREVGAVGAVGAVGHHFPRRGDVRARHRPAPSRAAAIRPSAALRACSAWASSRS